MNDDEKDYTLKDLHDITKNWAYHNGKVKEAQQKVERISKQLMDAKQELEKETLILEKKASLVRNIIAKMK